MGKQRASITAIFGLLCAAAAPAAVLTVGPGGTHATIQGAIDAAIAAPGSDEVRIHTGTYTESLLVIVPGESADQLDISGGWDDAYAAATPNERRTTIKGTGAGSVVQLSAFGGAVVLTSLTLRDGHQADNSGGGIRAFLDGGDLTVRNCHIRQNFALNGGGLDVSVQGASVFTLEDSTITKNRAQWRDPAGAGLRLAVRGEATAAVTGNRITANQLVSELQPQTGAGFFIGVLGQAQLRFDDNEVRANRLDGVASGAGPAAGALWVFDQGQAVARRNRFIDNQDKRPDVVTQQLSLIADGSASLLFTDSIVADSKTSIGVQALAQGGTLRLVNLTVVDSGETGVQLLEESGTASLANTIVFGHSQNLDAAANVGRQANLIGKDPRFVDRDDRDYRLQANSPAANKGKNGALGRGPEDVDGEARIKSGRIDIGAHESQ